MTAKKKAKAKSSRKKYLPILEDPNARRWYVNLSKGSLIAADIRLRSLGRFLDKVKMSPKQYASLPQTKMEDVAQDYLNELETATSEKTGRPYSPGYISNCLDAIRSWADWNRKPFLRTIKISNPNRTPTLEDERSPTQDELRRVLYSDKTSLRTRSSIAIMGFAGCRPEVQGDYHGLEGLRIKDLTEMEIVEDREIKFLKVPTMIVVREELSKIGKQYFTMLGEEGCEILKDYLERRMSDGEKLSPSTPVIAAFRNQAGRQVNFGVKDESPFLATGKISEGIREAMRAVGLPWRPYVWRVYFDTAMLTAEGKGMISHAFQQFVMGHSGDIERTYTLSKHRLPEVQIEDIRRAVKRALQFLETRRPKDSDREMLKMLREGLLLSRQRPKSEIDKLDLEGMSNEDFFKELNKTTDREAGGATATKEPPPQEKLNAQQQQTGRHTAVPIGQLESLLASGFRYVDKYTNEDGRPMAIVEFA